MFRNLRFMLLGVLACMLFILLLTGFSAHHNVSQKLKLYLDDSKASESASLINLAETQPIAEPTDA